MKKDMKQERIQKLLAAAGVASRRAVEKMIVEGRITVNGKLVDELGTTADAINDKIAVDGKVIQLNIKKIYLALFKPRGVLSTVSDDKGRPTIMDYLVREKCKLFPIGRLDYNTDGIILVTNDGELAHRLLHPAKKIDKVYEAQVNGLLTAEQIEQLQQGVQLEDGLTAPAKAEVLWQDETKNVSLIKLAIFEGRNRQVRRMFAALGYDVQQLRRVEFAGMSLSGLRRGQYRRLTMAEIKKIRQLAGL